MENLDTVKHANALNPIDHTTVESATYVSWRWISKLIETLFLYLTILYLLSFIVIAPGRCILWLDLWIVLTFFFLFRINGCVGYHNHKIFFLFLFYTLLYLAMLFYHCVCLVLETIKIYPSFLASLKFVWSMYKAYFVTVWTILWNLWQNAWNRASLPLLTGAPALVRIRYPISPYSTILLYCVEHHHQVPNHHYDLFVRQSMSKGSVVTDCLFFCDPSPIGPLSSVSSFLVWLWSRQALSFVTGLPWNR
jgi:hypothetical protein